MKASPALKSCAAALLVESRGLAETVDAEGRQYVDDERVDADHKTLKNDCRRGGCQSVRVLLLACGLQQARQPCDQQCTLSGEPSRAYSGYMQA